MQITITSRQIQLILYVIAWIIFIGLCIETVGFIINACATWFLKPEVAERFWREIDLSDLHKYDRGHFAVTAFIVALVAVMKAFMFYLIVRILHNKKLNLEHPFRKEVGRFIFYLSYLTLLIGLFADRGVKYFDWMITNGVKMPGIQQAGLGGADVWLFMSATLFVIAHIFKRGIDIQTENELTV